MGKQEDNTNTWPKIKKSYGAVIIRKKLDFRYTLW